MTTSTWDAFFPHVLHLVPGCDTDTATFYIRQAAIEFLRDSQAWKQEIPISTTADLTTYTIPFPTDAIGSMLASFVLIDTDGVPNDEYEVLSPAAGRDADRNFVDACYVYLSDDGLTLNITPPPESDAMTAIPFFSLKPTQASAGIPSWLFEQYVDAIAAGALGKLMALSGKPWSNPGLSAMETGKASSRAGQAAVRESRGKSRARTRSKAFLY